MSAEIFSQGGNNGKNWSEDVIEFDLSDKSTDSL